MWMVLQLEGQRKENKVKLVDFQIKDRAKCSTHQRGSWSNCWPQSHRVASTLKREKLNCLIFNEVGQGHGPFEVDGQIV